MRKYLLPLLLSSFLLAGCASAPTPFETGAEAPAPSGCIEGRVRGADC